MLTVKEWKEKLFRNYEEKDFDTLQYAADMFELMIDGNHKRPQSECIELRDYAKSLMAKISANK